MQSFSSFTSSCEGSISKSSCLKIKQLQIQPREHYFNFWPLNFLLFYINSTVNSQLECQNVILPAEWCYTLCACNFLASPSRRYNSALREGDKRQKADGRLFCFFLTRRKKLVPRAVKESQQFDRELYLISEDTCGIDLGR